MAQKLAVYKCDICGNVAEILTAGGADLMCCGQQMTMQAENTTDAAVEKHVPVLEKQDGGCGACGSGGRPERRPGEYLIGRGREEDEEEETGPCP